MTLSVKQIQVLQYWPQNPQRYFSLGVPYTAGNTYVHYQGSDNPLISNNGFSFVKIRKRQFIPAKRVASFCDFVKWFPCCKISLPELDLHRLEDNGLA